MIKFDWQLGASHVDLISRSVMFFSFLQSSCWNKDDNLSNSRQHSATWLLTWKAKSLYHVGTFLPTRFFLSLPKFKIIKIKLEKNTYTQANTYLLHISRNFKYIFKYILLYSLSLANCKQLRKCNRLYRSSLSAMF